MQTHGMYSTQLIVPFFKQFRPDLVIETSGAQSAPVAAGVYCRS